MSAPGRTRVGDEVRLGLISDLNNRHYKPGKNVGNLVTWSVLNTFFEIPVFKIIFEIAVAFLQDSHPSHFRDQKAFEIAAFEIPVFKIKPSSQSFLKYLVIYKACHSENSLKCFVQVILIYFQF